MSATEPTNEKVNKNLSDDEDEDIDQLVLDLQSNPANLDDDEEAEEEGTFKAVPDELLQTDPRVGLTDDEVHKRRKRYGLNQMAEEQENLVDRKSTRLNSSHRL